MPVRSIILLQSVFNPSSRQADSIHRLFTYFNIAAGGMLLLVICLIIFVCLKYKKRKDDDNIPVHVKSHNLLEAAMIGFPTLLLIWFFFQTLQTMNDVVPSVPAERIPDVIVTGHQWWWEVYYPASQVTAANEVHLPVGKELLIEMRSADVIHDWWVPELGNKIDLVPSTSNYLWLNIHKPGVYKGACSEFCGAQHAWMRIQVIAQDQSDFNEWLAKNSQEAVVPHGELAQSGYHLLQRHTCAGCHRVGGTEATASVGPDLTHIASRKSLLTGLLENTAENLSKWISDPQKIKPGSHMPDFRYPKDSIEAIVQYLVQLK